MVKNDMKDMLYMKIITGGQSGADLAGNRFAKKHGFNTEINAEQNYKPLYDDVPEDIKINVVSLKDGPSGGWIERRRYNVTHSDFTLILLNKAISKTKGSRGTVTDCQKFIKNYAYIDIYKKRGICQCYSIRDHRVVIGASSLRQIMEDLNPSVINIAGQRDLNEKDAIRFLEEIFLNV